MKYDTDKTGIERFLGVREADVMAYLWDCCSPRSLAQVCYFHSGGKAKTTIQTTLNRLWRKGLLVRTGGKQDYRYYPAEPRDVWEARQLAIVRESLDNGA